MGQNEQTKEAKEFLSKGDMHQTLRREIQFGLIPTTTIDGPNQTQSLLYVKFMLEHGGFLRDNGLNSLPSIKKLSSILNLPNGFNFDIKVESIASLCKKSKFLQLMINYYTLF